MTASIRKWGNSAAVRIPAAALAAAGLKPDDPVEIREDGGRIIIEKAKRPPITLESLLEGMTPDNLHEETDWGEPVGRELW